MIRNRFRVGAYRRSGNGKPFPCIPKPVLSVEGMICMSDFSSLILAAGEGKRMKSTRSKVVHKVCGREMINCVVDAVCAAGADSVTVVVGHCAQQVKDAVGDRADFALQEEQLGTGHAVMQARESLLKSKNTMILTGDTPLITAETLKAAAELHAKEQNDVTVLTMVLDNPFGYGRIIRGAEGRVEAIVEQKDATDKQQAVREVNSGMYCFNSEKLLSVLDSIKSDNSQGEYYLTDAIALINRAGGKVGAYVVENSDETLGVNDRVQLCTAERIMRRRINEKFMRGGVTIIDPDNTYICAEAQIGIDTVIYPGTVIEGQTVIGQDVYVGPNCRLIDAVIDDGVDINISTVVKSRVGKGTHVGPYAYIRPDCVVGEGCKVGDFVELKKASIGSGTKLSHLTYVGDAEVGSGVNFGCGTVTVNYDGKKKYKTVIEDNAFIGCNTNLVSPVTVHEGAYIAAGSTITDDVPKDNLAIARARQVNKESWNDRRKK